MNKLLPGLLLDVVGHNYPSCLTGVFKSHDDDLVGLTTVWSLLSRPYPRLLALRGSGVVVGRCERLIWEEDGGEDSEVAADHERETVSPGVLTATFVLLDKTFVSPSLIESQKPSLSFFSSMGAQAVVGGKVIGLIERFSDDQALRTDTSSFRAFPLLRLARSQEDIKGAAGQFRNGALVTDSRGTMIGVIVNISNEGRSYSVAPMEDVLSFHGLQIPTQADIERWNSRQAEYRDYVGKSHYPELSSFSEGLDARSQQRRLAMSFQGGANAG